MKLSIITINYDGVAAMHAPSVAYQRSSAAINVCINHSTSALRYINLRSRTSIHQFINSSLAACGASFSKKMTFFAYIFAQVIFFS